MQWILGAVIIGATTYLGFALKARCRRRVRQLEEIERLIRHLGTKLCYLKERLVPIMEEIRTDASPEFSRLLDDYIAQIRSGNRSYAKLKSSLPRMQLEEGEFDDLCAMLDGLGNSDADMQERALKHFSARFSEYRERAEGQLRIQGGMYPKFGFMGGLLLCILLW